MKTNRKLIFITILLLIIVGSLIQCDTEKSFMSNPNFEGEYTIKWNDLPKLKSGSDFKLGGFESLDYIGGQEFVLVTNRGPVLNEVNGMGERVNFLEPEFTPEIVKVKLKDNNSIEIIERHPIKTLKDENVSGLPSRDDVEIINDGLSTEFWGMNPGGIIYNPNGNSYWVADKYEPALFQITGRWGNLGTKGGYGNIIRRFRPTEGLRPAFAYRVGDGGFSGIDVDEDNRLWMTIEKNLINYPVSYEGEIINVLDSLPLFKDRRRIVRKDPDGFYEKNAAYMVEPESFDGVKVEDVSLMGIVAYNDSTCYVCEYGKTGNNVRSLLVKVICNSETWYGPSIERMSFIDSLRTLHLRTIETLTELARDSSNFNYAVRSINSSFTA